MHHTNLKCFDWHIITLNTAMLRNGISIIITDLRHYFMQECVLVSQTDDQVHGQGQSRIRQPVGRNQRPGCSRPVLHKPLVSSSAAEAIVEDTW